MGLINIIKPLFIALSSTMDKFRQYRDNIQRINFGNPQEQRRRANATYAQCPLPKVGLLECWLTRGDRK